MSRLAMVGALAFALIVSIVSTASADVPVQTFGILPSTTQAGGHPDLQIGFALKNGQEQFLEEGVNTSCNCENARFITIHAPPGLVGNPHATPQCTAAQFSNAQCPVDSQVGVVEVGLSATPVFDIPIAAPVYNLVPREGEAGLLAFSGLGVSVFESFSARTQSDYGLETKIAIPNGTPLGYADQILWGVPADPSHDALRFSLGAVGRVDGRLCDENGVPAIPNLNDPTGPLSGPSSVVEGCSEFSGTGQHYNSPAIPFVENPTACGEPIRSGIDVLAYDDGATGASAPFPEVTGCDQLSFNPSLAARASTGAADSPSGLDVHLTVPQFLSPTVPSPSEIRGTEMLLPEGFTINASAADGKSACTDLEASFGTENAANCPDPSKVGTLNIETALLPGPLPGYVYLGRPLPGNRYRIFLVADGFAVHVKLAGSIKPDPGTGRLAVVFEDLPQTPFERFTLHIFGSERGALATPTKCGTYPITTTFTPWDSALGTQSSKTFFTVDSGPNGRPCPGTSRPFSPGFEAGSSANAAGAHSPFVLRLTRQDGDQFLSALNVKTPPGLAATLKGVPYCPEAAIAQAAAAGYSGVGEQANSSCPSASQIGEVIGGAGAGSRPVYAPGKAYLAGPYKGAPLSLVVVVPAVSGPYDLGNIVVRNALRVDPVSARVSAISDPLPRIVEGVPLRVRSVLVDLDRPNFTINPTNCDPHSVDTEISGAEGASASPSSHFQVANCANLPFAPRLSLRLIGGTRRTAHPALRATLRPRAGDANISGLSVALPHSEFLDQSHIGTVCTRVQFAADQCPAASVYGHATATTPLLDQPLEGPVYLRSSSHNLPDLVLALKGPPSQPIAIEAAGRVDTDSKGGIRTTFEATPDAAITSFTLSMRGADKGLLQNSTNICASPQRATVRAIGQNGKRVNFSPPVSNASCKGKGRKARHRSHRRAARAVR
jgi:hypothetical protein